MEYLELDTSLSDEAKAMSKTAEKFGMEVMRPAGIELDRLAEPEEVIADGSVLWDVIKQFRELGFHKTAFAKEFGGMREDMDPKTGPLVSEAMGYADAGLAVSLGASGFPFQMAAFSQEPELKDMVRAYCEDTEGKIIGCWAITEPDHGSVIAQQPTISASRSSEYSRAQFRT
ncbi:MAG: hypothetical protein A2V67_00485 [Deltaproteobacteria bacterium RBG_13_61_14]|nr:MAG: hypothetical protein A2V67_00485 [Deltaproteobacteria bacterium RBG_13_61_14]